MATALRSFPTFRSLGSAATLVAVVATAPELHAQDWGREPSWYRDRAADGRVVSVEVRVDGDWTPLFARTNSDQRLYFEAKRRKNYELRIRNLTGRRVGVLISVDGLNVVNGERSSLSNHEPMYVLDPWERTTIRGWRTSLNDVRRFVFVDEERSYAERTGQANGDMGWIRVLAFEEQRRYEPWVWRRDRPGYGDNDEIAKRQPRSDDAKTDGGLDRQQKGSADAGAPPSSAPETGAQKGTQKSGPDAIEQHDGDRRVTESSPGTGWGDRRRDPVRRTHFDPEYRAADHLVLRYEYARGLASLGIPLDWARLGQREYGAPGFARAPGW